MKKLITIFTALILLFSTPAIAAKDDHISARAKAAFEKDFSNALSVSWQKKEDFYFARFVMNEFEVNAAYNDEGELLGTSRVITIAQLPLNISLLISKKYGNYSLNQKATEVNFEGETQYFVTIHNPKQMLVLKLRTNGQVSVDKKVKYG